MQSEFTERAQALSPHGLGLSVDVYSPPLMELVQALRDRRVQPKYMEIFKATTSALRWVRAQLPELKLTYHGEGLWVTQPNFRQSGSGRQGLAEACAQIAALGAAWSNHECATKSMAGFAFGTYLPPLYTELSARMTADNLHFVQAQFDEQAERQGVAPTLLLLEMPPMTYFACGSLSVPAFFSSVTESAACGLVLDIGHLWTVYRYTGAWRRRSLQAFTAEFLDAFPMERVVEIHVAGLAERQPMNGSQPELSADHLPLWIDAHGEPIPDLLLEMLEQVLASPRLTALKGVALEVDTKPIETIVEEFAQFHERFHSQVRCAESGAGGERSTSASQSWRGPFVTLDEQARLDGLYQGYVALATGVGEPPIETDLSLLGGTMQDLDRYRRRYLPQELLQWGGELTAMFPRTCALLAEAGVPLAQFVSWWFHVPRAEQEDYDFFLLKIDRFVEFTTEVCPAACASAREEAAALRAAYQTANEPLTPMTMEPVRT